MNMQTHPALETFRSHDPGTHGFESVMRRLGWRRLFAILVGLVMLALSGHASAQTCTGTDQTVTIPLPASVTVPASATVGTLLTSWVATPYVNYMTCSGGTGTFGPAIQGVSFTASGVSITDYPVWKTNVPGIGIAMGFNYYCGSGLQTLTITSSGTWTSGCFAGASVIGGQFTAVLVKTGPITPGTITGQIVAQVTGRYGGPSGPLVGPTISFATSSTAIIAPTCTFSVPNIPLGSFSATSFTGNTSTPEVSVPLTVSNCPSDAVALNMSFGGTADTTNPALFAASSVTGNVTGVGIGLKYTTPSSQTPMAVTPNVTTAIWRLGLGNTMQLFANFVQTLPKVTAGTVSTPITIQFTYQ